MIDTVPPVAMFVRHRVRDYDTWKKMFDDHMAARKAASCLGHHINRGADDPYKVYVYCPATDPQRLRAFVESADLPDVMKRAGVEGRPAVNLMKPMSVDIIPDRILAGIIVEHAVEDYDRWRIAYDDFDGFRKKCGIIGHAVNQELDDPNRVIVYHQAETPDSLRTFLESTELREAMQRAGVRGTPDSHYVQVADFGEY
jgi:hypothetical protein